jgi:lipopolysaccharide export system permease protein
MEKMTIITKYILKEHVSPFFFGLGTIVFIFLLNVLFRDLGRLLGKGLPAGIIIEFFIFNMAWIVALAIPMSVLIATLMAFGRLSSENEIAALKASGVHFYRLLIPVLVVSLILAIGLERFNNCVLPDFNHQLRLLYSDISRKRPSLTLEPNVFFDDIPNYNLLVQEIDEKRDILKGIIINDTSDPSFNKTIIAERGRLHFSKEREQLVFSLFNGEVHEVDQKSLEDYRRLIFENQTIYIPVTNMVLKRSDSQHRGDREKSAAMMRKDVQSHREAIDQKHEHIQKIVQKDLSELFPEEIWRKESTESSSEQVLPSYEYRAIHVSRVNRILMQIQGEMGGLGGYLKSMSRLQVEIEKKYSIPAACLVFVLIGAPLGIMARQGGIGVGGGLSTIFFLIYWAFLIGGEQLADRRLVHPIVAMWSPNLVVGVGGIYLVVRAVKEVKFIPWDQWAQKFRKIFRRRK